MSPASPVSPRFVLFASRPRRSLSVGLFAPVVSSVALALALAVLAVAPATAQATPEALDLPALAAAIEAPQVGAAVKLDGPIQVGRATVTPGAATAVRRLTAGGQPVGLLIDGPAQLRYLVDDAFSAPVARRNLKRASSLAVSAVGKGLAISEPLRGAVVWNRQLAAAAPPAGETAAAGALPGWAREILDNLLGSRPSSWMIADMKSGHGPRDSSTYALLHGEHDDLRLVVDPLVGRSESLARFGKLAGRVREFKGSQVVYELADQPIGRPWWERTPAPLVVVHESIKVDNAGARDTVVTTRSRVKAIGPGWSVWRVNLVNELYDGEHRLEVRAVSATVDGKPAAWVHQGGELLVDLGRTLATGDIAEVVVVDQGPLAVRPNNDSYWYLTTWPWYPQPDLAAEYATLEMEVRVPEPFVPFASGDTVSRTTENGVNVLRTATDKPVQFPVVAAGKYHLYEEDYKGIHANVLSYAFGKEKAAKVLAGLIFGATDAFEQFFGVAYPFKELDMVEINSWGFGQAPPGVIFITNEAYNPINDTISRFFSQGVNGRIVHEVAHTWWGHLIKMDSSEEQWLTESFADYSAALAMQSMLGGKKGDREFAQTLREWKSRAAEVGDAGSIYLANYLAGEDEADFRDRTFLLYDKGPLVLHALRQELGRRLGSAEKGDKYFQALLRTFVTNFALQRGETRHLVGILTQMTGSDWQPWFEKYVYGTEMPPVDL